MKKVLFVTYGGGHVAMLIPIIQALRERDDLRCITIALTMAGSALEQYGIPYRGFSSLIRDGDDRAIVVGERLADELRDGGGVNREESIAYLGLSYVDLEQRVGVNEARSLYMRKGRQSFLPLEPMKRLFDEVEPDLVVTTISPRAEQAAQLVARERGVPSICLIDLFDKPSIERASESGYGVRICVISEGVRRRLLAAGRRQEEVVVTGNPAFDVLGCPQLSAEGRRMRTERAWGKDFVILWASQVEPKVHPFNGVEADPTLPGQIEQELLSLIVEHSDWRLVIRPHPSEGVRKNPDTERVDISTQNDNLEELLEAVDVVVTMTSTVGLQGRLLGKPLITVDLSVFSNDSCFEEAGLSFGVKKLSQLGPALERIVLRGNEGLEELPRPGGACQAVIKQIDALLEA